VSNKQSTLTVELDDRSYDIVVGSGLLANAGELIRPLLDVPRAVIITDKNVEKHWLGPLENSLSAAGISHKSIVLAAGEKTKCFDELQKLCDRLLEAKAERSTMLIALGGGVVGDITGFAASITLRGLDFIQIPTTLLAQVDSSVGGKTGINAPQGKNLIGAFHQPRLVLADIATLKTLSDRERRCGYAEIVKYGLIGDAEFFSWLEDQGHSVIAGETDACHHAILTSCRAKADIVADDEKEKGRRALLNLGHTFGHGLEAQVGYGDALYHGEAVAIGMVMAFDLSRRLDLCPRPDRDRLVAHLKDIGLPVGLQDLDTNGWSAAELINLMGQDKKVRDGELTFVLARGIGQAFITDDVELEDVTAILEEHLQA